MARQVHEIYAEARFMLYQDLPVWSGDPPRQSALPASECWIYLFRCDSEAISLSHEIYANAGQGYQPVDLAAHYGRNKRPPADEFADLVTLPFAEVIASKMKKIRYFALLSPFQLHWSRLFDFGPKRKIVREKASAFFRWAHEERDLESFELDSPDMVSVCYLWAPWHQAVAYHRRYLAAIREFEQVDKSQGRIELRTLASFVRDRIKDPECAKCISIGELERVEHDLKWDKSLEANADSRADDLARFMNGPRMREMHLDMAADPTAAAYANYLPRIAGVFAQLERTRAGRRFLTTYFGEYEHLVDFDITSVGKPGRKLLKAFWYTAKAFVTMAVQKHGPRVRFTNRIEKWARWLHVDLIPDFEKAFDPSNLGPNELSFKRWKYTPESETALKARVSENPALTGFMAVVDVFNLAVVAHKFVSVMGHDEADDSEKWRAQVALLGAMASATSSYGSFVKARDVAGATRSQSVVASTVESSVSRRLVDSKGIIARKLVSDTVRSRLSMLAAACDFAIGSADFHNRLELGGDLKDYAWPGLTALGGLVAGIGFLFATCPVGAALVVFGSLLGFGGSLGAALFPPDPMKDWLRHCFCGTERELTKTIATEWSNGPLLRFSRDYKRQIEALGHISFRMDVSCQGARNSSLDLWFLELKVAFQVLYRESKVYLGLRTVERGGQREIRSFSPWESYRFEGSAPSPAPPPAESSQAPAGTAGRAPQPEPPPDGSSPTLVEMFEAPGVRLVGVEIQLDLLGDGTILYPEKPLVRTFEISRFTL